MPDDNVESADGSAFNVLSFDLVVEVSMFPLVKNAKTLDFELPEQHHLGWVWQMGLLL
jgi:hypothetical protein